MTDDKKIDLSGVDDIYKTPSKDETKKLDLSGLDKIYKKDDSEEPSQTEAALRGTAQGITSNFEPRIVGGVEGLYHKVSDPGTQKLADLYNKYKEIQEQKNETAKNAYPKTYLGGQLAGGAAQMAVPGLGIAGDASILGAGAKTAALAGLSGLGATNDITADPTQTAVNVAIPAAIGGVIGGSAKALTSLRNAPKASQLASDAKEAFQQGRQGIDLTTPGAAKDASKEMLGLGQNIQESLDSNGKRIGSDINKAYDSSEANDLNLNDSIKDKMTPILDDLHELKSNQTDPTRANDVQKIIDNIMQGITSPETEGTSPNVARELRDTLSARSRLAKSPVSPDTFPALTGQATKAAQGVGDTLNSEVLGLAPANAQYSANSSAQDLLKAISPLFERENIQNQKQIAQVIADVQGKGLKSASAEEFINRLKDYANESGNPELANIIENKAPDITKRFDLTQKIQSNTPSINPLKLAKPTLLGAANKAGNTPLVGPAIEGATNAVTSPFQEAASQAVSRVVPGKFIQGIEDNRKQMPPLKYPDQGSTTDSQQTEKPLELSKNLYASNSEQLKGVAQSLSQDPTLKSLSTSLNQAIDNNDTMRKNSTLFALLQNPRARQIIYGKDPDEV